MNTPFRPPAFAFSGRWIARLLGLALLLSLFTACSSMNARRNPAVPLNQFQRFYVEQRLNDNHGIGERIAADLRARGYTATCDHLTMMPENTEVLITYDARWSWDFRSYLINLEITARRAYANAAAIIATGNYHHPGVTSKSPETMIRSLLDDFFH